MRSATRRAGEVLASVLLVAASAAPARAQSLWMDREARTSVRVEMRFPTAGDDFPYSQVVRYAAFVTMRMPVRPATWLVVEAPYAGYESQGFEELDGTSAFAFHEGVVGNPYLGLEFAKRTTGLHYEVGLRPPLVRSSAGFALTTGAESDVEREQAFADHAFSMRAGLLYHRMTHAKSPMGYDLRLGATWQIPTARSGSAAPTDGAYPYDPYWDPAPHALYVEHAMDVRLEGAHAYFGIGIAGRWLASARAGSFDQDSVEELSVALEILRGPIHPGVTVATATDADLQRYIGSVVSLSLTVGAGRHDRWWRTGGNYGM